MILRHKIQNLIESIVKQELYEFMAVSTGGGSVQSSGQIDGASANGVSNAISDDQETVWSEESERENKKTSKKNKFSPPFPKYKGDADETLVTKFESLYKTGKNAFIDLNDPNLYSTQKYVKLDTIEKQLSGEWKPSSKLPVVIELSDGRRVIQDGHHRLSYLKLSGKDKAEVYLIQRPEDYELDEDDFEKNYNDFFAKKSLQEEELEEYNAMGSGAVVGYTLPLGAKSPFSNSKNNKKKYKRWYDVKREGK